MLIRGSFISINQLKDVKAFPISPLEKEKITDIFVRTFINKYFDEYTFIDKTTGYILQGIHEQYPIIRRLRIKVYLKFDAHYYDKLFIDRDKILFMNSQTGKIRRVNPDRIEMVVFDLLETKIINF